MSRLLIVLFCSVCVEAQAQMTATPSSNTLDAYWNVPLTSDQKLQTVSVKSQTSIPDPVSASTAINVNQTGMHNQTMLQTVAGTQNRLDVNQFGNANNADAILSGTNNSLILNQMGDGNRVNISLTGTNNRFMLTQDGGDTVNMQGLQKDNTRLELSQGRGNNSFTLDNSSLLVDPLSKGAANLRIEQSGGSSVTIQQGRVIGN